MTLPRVVIVLCAFALAFAGSAAGADVSVVTRDESLRVARVLAGGPSVLPARAAPARFNLVGLHWRGSGEVWFRTASLTGPWSAWRVARPEEEDRPDPDSAEARARAGWNLGNPYWTGAARRIQYRVSGRVTRLRAHFVWSPLRSFRRLSIAATPTIIPRTAWGANEAIVRGGPSYAERLAFAVVHHTAGASPSTPAQSAAIVRGIQAYHVRSNGWKDIGYNFLVDGFGQVFEGRGGGVEQDVIGAHAAGFNTGSVGIAVIGTYGATAISPAAREALISLLAWRLDVGHVDPASRLVWTSAGSARFPAGTRVWLNAVSGHRDTGLTSCPGSVLYGELGRIAASAAERGLPKIYDPRFSGSAGGPIRFTARLSTESSWTITVSNPAGEVVASGAGSGTAVDWTWDATGIAPGRYTYAIEAGAGFRPARGPVGPAVPLELAGLHAAPAEVTPNGDGVSDTTSVRFWLTAPATARVWLEDEGGAHAGTVMSARWLSSGQKRVFWNPAAISDGRYRLVAEASAGTERKTLTAPVVVDRTLSAFRVRPAAFSPNGDGRRETVTARFGLARDADVALRIDQGARTVTTTFTGRLEGGAERSLSWDGKLADGTVVRDGRYRALVLARTSLGTRSLGAHVVVDTAPPRFLRASAVRTRGATILRLVLSERARVRASVGGAVVTARLGPGRASVRIPARGRLVRAVARDAAGNVSRPLARTAR